MPPALAVRSRLRARSSEKRSAVGPAQTTHDVTAILTAIGAGESNKPWCAVDVTRCSPLGDSRKIMVVSESATVWGETLWTTMDGAA